MDDNVKSLDTKKAKKIQTDHRYFAFDGDIDRCRSLRMMNTNWMTSQHPPGRAFSSQVIAQIRPVGSISEYFDTTFSSEPNTHGHTFLFMALSTIHYPICWRVDGKPAMTSTLIGVSFRRQGDLYDPDRFHDRSQAL